MNHIYKSKWSASLGAWVACSELAKGRGKTRSLALSMVLACLTPFLLTPERAIAAACPAGANGTFRVDNNANNGCNITATDVAPVIGNVRPWNQGFTVYSSGGISRSMNIGEDIDTTLKGGVGILVYNASPGAYSTFNAAGKTINLTIGKTDATGPAPAGDNVAKVGVEVRNGSTVNIGTLNLTMRDLPNGADGSLFGQRFEHYGVLAGSSNNAGETAAFNGLDSSAVFDNLNIDMQSVASTGLLASRYPLLAGIRAIQGAHQQNGYGSAGYVEVNENLTINLDATANDAIGIYVSGSGDSGAVSRVKLNNSDIKIKSTSIRANAIRLGKDFNVGLGVGQLYSTGHMNIDTTLAPNDAAIDVIWQGAILDANADTSSTTIVAGNSVLGISGQSSQSTVKTITSFNNLKASTVSTTANLVEIGTGQNDYELNMRGGESLLNAAPNGYLINVAGGSSNPSQATFNFAEGVMSGLVNKTDASTLNINMDSGATWNLKARASGGADATFSTLDMKQGSVLNAFNGAGDAQFQLWGNVNSANSIINLSDGKVGDVLTINGNYTGTDAQLLVDSIWNDPDTQQNDLLIIEGDAGGSTTVSVPGGIIGDVTQSDVPKNGGEWLSPVVTVQGTDIAGPNTFTGTAETTNAGQAQLVKKDNSYFWTLQACPEGTTPENGQCIAPTPPEPEPEPNPQPEPKPEPEPKPTPILTPGTSGYVQMSRINREMGLAQLGTLHKRVGEQQTWAWDECGTECADYRQRADAGKRPSPIWGRMHLGNLKEQGKERFGYKSDSGFIQFGADVNVKTDEERNHRHIGVMATYSHGEHDFYDKNRAENGVVSANKHTGSGTTDMLSLGGYSTWYSVNGTYVDLVGNVSFIHNKYESTSGNASQNGYGLGASVEVGRPWQLGNSNWQIEPQAQLSYQYVHLKGFNDDVRNIDAQNDGTLRARLGARLAWNNDNGKQHTSTFYVTANVLHDLTGSRSKASVGKDKLSERYARTWSELGVGAQLALGKSTYLYGDVSYERSLGGYSNQVYRGTDTAREGFSGRIGLRYTW